MLLWQQKANRHDAAAIQMVSRMDALFLVNRVAREKQMTIEERLASRRQHANVWAKRSATPCDLRKSMDVSDK
jgi:hypothetical protein